MSSKFNSPKARHKTPAVCWSKREIYTPPGPKPPIPKIPVSFFATIEFQNSAAGFPEDYNTNKVQLIETIPLSAWYVDYFVQEDRLASLYVSYNPVTNFILWELALVLDWQIPQNWDEYEVPEQTEYSLNDWEIFIPEPEGPPRRTRVQAGNVQDLTGFQNPLYTPIMIGLEAPEIQKARLRLWA